MRLEHIVRPFQTFDVTPPARIVDPNEPDVPNLVLKFGENGQIKTLTATFSSEMSSYTDDKQTELSRETTVKRIENPDDPSQFVEVEVIDKLTTEKGSQDTYKKTEFNFKNHVDA